MSLIPSAAPIIRPDTRSIPPTNLPLSMINEASQGQNSYGSGGGGGSVVSTFTTASVSSLTVSSINGAVPGGSVSPNLGVSTLTVNSAGAVEFNTAGNGDSGYLVWNTATDGSQGMEIAWNNALAGGYSANGHQLAVVAFNGGTTTGTAPLAVNGINFGNSYIGTAAGSIGITGDGSQILLTGVSSINGAAPGGGGAVSPDLALSTLVMNGSITMANNSIILDGASSVVYASSGDGNIYVSATKGKSVNVGNGDNVSALVANVDGATVNGTLNVPNVANISSLTVSSINGVAPGGSGAPQFYSTISSVTIAAQTSSILTEIPLGTCAYSFLGDNTTNDAVVTGMMNLTIDTNGNKFASLGATFYGGPNANVFPYIDLTTTPGTPLFGLANDSPFILETTGALNRIV
jgi:hypothetical protein